MNVDDNLNRLSEKIDQVLGYIKRLEEENAALKSQRDSTTAEQSSLQESNERLQEELEQVRQECHRLKLEEADRAEAITTKLSGVLARLDELEQAEG